MCRVIFTGPSLPPDEIIEDKTLPSEIIKCTAVDELENHDFHSKAIVLLPPIKGGDAYKLSEYNNISAVGIIDGVFENTVSVWHKEILNLLNMGVIVLGSSSMGALRAVENNRYGMIGIGKVFSIYDQGIIEDDDEVAIIHGPADMQYICFSEALVNMRFTLDKALRESIISQSFFEAYLTAAKSTFYKERNYGSIIHRCVSNLSIEQDSANIFLDWLEKNRVNQKKIDAWELIQFMASERNLNEIDQKPFEFHDTMLWRGHIKK